LDFSSLKAFDRHLVADKLRARTKWNAYPLRCLDTAELEQAGMDLDSRGRWQIAISEAEQVRLADLRAA
jgi:hypothetical protein